MKGRYWIISNYDYDPSAVIAAIDSDDYVLCQQGAQVKVPAAHRDSRFAPAKHSGHNLSDYLQFLVEHYSDLPPEVGFIKGNVFPRHIDKQTFCERIQHRAFVPLYSSGDTYAVTRRRLPPFGLLAQQVAPGIYLEAASSWYVKTRNTGQHFPTLESMFVRITGRKPPLYIPFVPGACMVVPRENITRWPRELFAELYAAVTYSHFPVEAFHLERCMLYLFSFPVR